MENAGLNCRPRLITSSQYLLRRIYIRYIHRSLHTNSTYKYRMYINVTEEVRVQAVVVLVLGDPLGDARHWWGHGLVLHAAHHKDF